MSNTIEVKVNLNKLDEIIKKIPQFHRAVIENAENNTKENILSSIPPAFDTGELYSSIHSETDDYEGRVYSDCEHAIYVEFGAGIVGQASPHPSGNGVYRNSSWTYYDENIERFIKTKGFISRPFMFNAVTTTKNQLKDIAGEIFEK